MRRHSDTTDWKLAYIEEHHMLENARTAGFKTAKERDVYRDAMWQLFNAGQEMVRYISFFLSTLPDDKGCGDIYNSLENWDSLITDLFLREDGAFYELDKTK